jgi:hypothetical protein
VTLSDGIAASSSNPTPAAAAAATASGMAVARTGPGTFGVNVTVPTATVGKLTRVAFHIQPGTAADLAGHLSQVGGCTAVLNQLTHSLKAPGFGFNP